MQALKQRDHLYFLIQALCFQAIYQMEDQHFVMISLQSLWALDNPASEYIQVIHALMNMLPHFGFWNLSSL